ncbi:MAG: hypothetical protein AABY11_03485 [archaeon]
MPRKLKKSMFGALVDKNNPISMEEIVKEIKKDRRESDERREAVFDAIIEKAHPAKKHSTRFSRRLKSLSVK